LVIQRFSIGAAIKKVIVYAAMYCILMTPWWLHNYEAYGEFVRLNLGGGIALYSANNPSNRTGGLDVTLKESAPFDHITNPVARDKAFQRAAIANIENDPKSFLIQALKRFERFWYPWPYAEQYSSLKYKIISLCSFVPILLLAFVFLFLYGHSNFRRIAPLLLFGAYLTAIHMLFPGSLRYRLPLEPFLIIFAAAGMIHLTERWHPKDAMMLKG